MNSKTVGFLMRFSNKCEFFSSSVRVYTTHKTASIEGGKMGLLLHLDMNESYKYYSEENIEMPVCLEIFPGKKSTPMDRILSKIISNQILFGWLDEKKFKHTFLFTHNLHCVNVCCSVVVVKYPRKNTLIYSYRFIALSKKSRHSLEPLNIVALYL